MLGRPREEPWTHVLSGLWVAGIGFFVTRFSVTLAAYETRTQFLLGGVVPLVVGLLLAAFGVALAVGAFDVGFSRVVAIWCTAGTLAMAVMVVFTLLGMTPDGSGAVRPQPVLSNFLIGGAVLGTLTGLYAGQDRRHRAGLRQQANRLVSINRILRHEVLNAVAVIRGRAEMLDGTTADGTDGESRRHLIEAADHIVDTVDDLKYLVRTAGTSTSVTRPVDLVAAVEGSVEEARERYPDAEFVVEPPDSPDVLVWADRQLSRALYPLLENAAAYAEAPRPTVTVGIDVGRDAACVRIEDEGPGLPGEHRATLEHGKVPDFDDPTAGFGTNVARMFVDGYGGDIRTAVSDEGSTVEVMLALATSGTPARAGARRFGSLGVDRSGLAVAAGAALVGGAVMGVFLQAMTGTIPIIGSLYGVQDPLVGWITHEFHSVVFGLVYAGLLSALPDDLGGTLRGRTAVGVAWGLFLAVVAAGVVMPAWLTLVGIPATVPSVSATALLTHLVWGVSVAGVYHLGATYWVDGGRRGSPAD